MCVCVRVRMCVCKLFSGYSPVIELLVIIKSNEVYNIVVIVTYLK